MYVFLQVLMTPPRADLVDKLYSGHDSKRDSTRSKSTTSIVGDKCLEHNQTRVSYDILICSLLFCRLTHAFYRKKCNPVAYLYFDVVSAIQTDD